MISLTTGVPRALLLTRDTCLSGETWQLVELVDLAGTPVGSSADAEPLVLPLTLTQVPGTSAWYSPAILIASAGQYVAQFRSSTGETVRWPVVVAGAERTSSTTTPAANVYASLADLRARYTGSELVQLADETGLVTVPMLDAALAGSAQELTADEQEALEAALERLSLRLADASRWCDGHLEGRFPVPITPVPDRLVEATCAITRYLLDTNPPEGVVKRYERETAWLKTVPVLGRASATQAAPRTTGPKTAGGQSPWDTRGF